MGDILDEWSCRMNVDTYIDIWGNANSEI
jgi:hypothetical protein